MGRGDLALFVAHAVPRQRGEVVGDGQGLHAEQVAQMLDRALGRRFGEPGAQSRCGQAGDVQGPVRRHLPFGAHPGPALTQPAITTPSTTAPAIAANARTHGFMG